MKKLVRLTLIATGVLFFTSMTQNSSAQNVGVNTDEPKAKLDVKGDASGTDVFRVFNDSDTLSFDSLFVIKADGSVGVKTDNPSEALEVRGDVNTIGGFGYKVDGLAPQNHFLKGDGTRFLPGVIELADLPPGLGADFIQNISIDLDFTLGQIADINLVGDVEIGGGLTVRNYIGIGTVSPAEELHLVLNQNSPTVFRIENTSSGTNALSAMRLYNDLGSSGGLFLTSSNHSVSNLQNNLVLLSDNTVSSLSLASSTNMRFLTGGYTNAANERMRISSAGLIGIGTQNPIAQLDIHSSVASAVRINPYNTYSGNTGQIEFMELASNGTNYVGFKAPDYITSNIVWSLPNFDGSFGQVLTTDGAGHLFWTTPGGGGSGTGDITQVGSIASGNAFSDNTSSNQWLGLGPINGRIQFTLGVPDQINFLDAYLGIGTLTPNERLTLNGVLSLQATTVPTSVSGYGKIFVNSVDGKLYYMDGLGNLSDLTASGSGLPSGSLGQMLLHNGTSWTASSSLYNNGSQVGINTTSPTADLHIDGSVRIEEEIYDGNNNTGTPGQVLASTGSSTEWVDMTISYTQLHGEMYEFNDAGSPINICQMDTFYGWISADPGSLSGSNLVTFTDSPDADRLVVGANGGGTYKINVSVSFSGMDYLVIEGAVFKNAVRQQNLVFRTLLTATGLWPLNLNSADVSGIIQLNPGDYLDFRFAKRDVPGVCTDDINIEALNFNIVRIGN